MLNKNSIQPLQTACSPPSPNQIKNGTYKPGEKSLLSQGTKSPTYQQQFCPTYRGGALHTRLSYQASGKNNCKIPMIFRKFESQRKIWVFESAIRYSSSNHALSFKNCEQHQPLGTAQLTSDEKFFWNVFFWLYSSIPVIDVHTCPPHDFPSFESTLAGSFWIYQNTCASYGRRISLAPFSVTAASPDMAKTLSSSDPLLICSSLYMSSRWKTALHR